MGSNPARLITRVLKKTAGEIMLALIRDFVSVQMIASLGSDNRPLACLLNPSFISQIDGDIKEPTPLFENSRGGFPGGVVYLNSMHHSYHGLWVGHSKLINEHY